MVKIPTVATERVSPAINPNPPDEMPEVSRDIMCPLTGELIERDDVDGLLDMYERLKRVNDQCYATLIQIRNTLYEQTEGDSVTRRVRGKRRQAKITLPDEQFDQSVLKSLWNSHEDLARQYMKIASLSVQMREFRKIVNTSSDQPDFVYFRDAMTKANRGRTGTPTIVVEF